MPFTDIPTLPTAPLRSQPADEFSDNAETWVSSLAAWTTAVNTVTGELEATAALIAVAPAYADAGLVSIADLTIGADEMLYGTATDTFGKTTITAFGRSLIDDVDASTARTTLGLGSLATASTINGGNWSGTDLAVADGGTGASSAATARTNLSAAASGANSDITSLSGLTTALSIAQGGTGAITAAGALANFLTVTSNANGICIAIPIGATTYMVQFGQTTIAANQTSATITFPVAFTTSSSIGCVANGVGDTANLGEASKGPTVRAVSTTAATVLNGDESSCTAFWIAVGY